MSDSLQPYRLQHARLPCPSLSPRICSDLCPLSRWCHQTISSSVALFSYPLTFPKSGSFPRSWLFPSGGQSIEASASASALPMKIQGWFPFRIDWFDLLAVQRTLTCLLQHHNSKASILQCSTFFMIQHTSIHNYWKNHNLDYMDLCQQSDVSAF